MITTPLSRLAEILNIDISSMNRADAQDAVCAEAEKNIRANQHRINQLHGRVAQTERENAELRARLHMQTRDFVLVTKEPTKEMVEALKSHLVVTSHGTLVNARHSIEAVIQAGQASTYPEVPDGSLFECVGSCNKTHPARDLKNTNITGSMTGVCRECWGYHPDIMIWTELPEFVPNPAAKINEKPQEADHD